MGFSLGGVAPPEVGSGDDLLEAGGWLVRAPTLVGGVRARIARTYQIHRATMTGLGRGGRQAVPQSAVRLSGGRVAGDLPPLRGREAELELLRRRLLAARQDGRGRVVVVSGAPGSGGSRLLREVRALAVEAGARTLHISGDPDEDLVPHGAVLDAVQAGPEPLLDRAVLAGLPAGPEQGWWLPGAAGAVGAGGDALAGAGLRRRPAVVRPRDARCSCSARCRRRPGRTSSTGHGPGCSGRSTLTGPTPTSSSTARTRSS
jgi:hypothetical protein